MRKTSLIKVALFSLAILANIRYVLFMLNPTHADNIGFYVVTVIADLIVSIIFVSTWATALYFELSKPRYYREIAELRKIGRHLRREKVAVLITVVNEDLSIVRNTIQCAKDLIGEKEVYLLDDGRRPEAQALALNMRVHYITRTDNRFFKAGNLNNALARHITEPFFIVVDADFALAPTFLQQTLPLFADPRIGAVQTPQVYSNEETLFSRGCKHLQDLFYTYVQPAKHLLGSAFVVGTNVIYRRAAIADIGGIVETADSEDIFTTLKLLENKYTVFFLDEPLATGLSPMTLISFYNQQYRWARGGLRMLFKHNTLFNRALHAEQRLQFLLSNVFYLSGISVLVYLTSPLIAVLFNIKPLSDAYMWEWGTSYIPFVCANLGLSMLLMKRYRLQALVLGLFSFAPYLNALRATLIGRAFRWKVTNTASKGIITKLLAPSIIYVCIAAATCYFLATGVLPYNPALILYYGWLGIDIILVAACIIYGYAATSKTTVPAFAQRNTLEITTAEVLVVSPQTGKVPAVQFQRGLKDYVPVENTPTMRLDEIRPNGKHPL
jgi:cellulose synthase (UDP-forming)